MSIIYTWTPKN